MDYSNILIPIDGSEDAKYASRVAADLTKAIPGKEMLHLLHCVSPIPNLIGGGQREKLMQEYQEEAERIFAAAKTILAETGNDCKTYIRYGETAPTITETAKELGCTLIIMGTRGVNELAGVVLGSVSHAVLQHATVPVLLVNGKKALPQMDT